MPNHVTNILITSPEVVDAITRHCTDGERAEALQRHAQTLANYKERTGNDWPYAESDLAEIEERFVDFNMLIPMPEAVSGTTVGTGGFDSYDERGWYGWSLAHWGTKWNGYSTRITPIEGDLCRLEFQTAWSHPEPVIHALSRKFPNEEIKVEWADEDFGSNLGTYTILDGEISDLFQPEFGSEDAERLAARLLYDQTLEEWRAEREQEERDWEEREARFKVLKAENPDREDRDIWSLVHDGRQALASKEN